jgi:proteasome lid subunit RPN8/RPN11
MLQALVSIAGRFVNEVSRFFARRHATLAEIRSFAPPSAFALQPLRRVVLTDGVSRTLFEEFATHHAEIGDERETGWLLLGVRQEEEAVVLATLPAGAQGDAGVGHVQFNSAGQVVASRIVRQTDKRLVVLGIVHTHPGSLRHPSDGDFRGDIDWVGQLKGREGIFGIGTADSSPINGTVFAHQPKTHVQCLGKLRLTWYALRAGDRDYRPLPVALTLGPDLARSLHAVWSTIEAHAERLDRLCRQQTGITFEVTAGEKGPALAALIPLAEPGQGIRVLLEGKVGRYYLVRNGEPVLADVREARVDRAVYLLLAELAAERD